MVDGRDGVLHCPARSCVLPHPHSFVGFVQIVSPG